MHKTLFVTVGRANPKPICTVSDDNPLQKEILAAQQIEVLRGAIASGVDANRVSFEIDDSGGEAANVKTESKVKGKRT